MQPDSTPQPVSAAPSSPPAVRWPFWAMILGGILLAAGLLLPIVPFLLFVAGLFNAYLSFGFVEAWDLAANVLEGLGFLSGFLGIAVALRLPSRGSPTIRARDFLAVFLGGVLVTAGILVATAFASYVMMAGPASFGLLLDIGEVAGRVCQAAGFILVFAGIAWSLRARL